jgi:hypothetical protein
MKWGENGGDPVYDTTRVVIFKEQKFFARYVQISGRNSDQYCDFHTTFSMTMEEAYEIGHVNKNLTACSCKQTIYYTVRPLWA